MYRPHTGGSLFMCAAYDTLKKLDRMHHKPTSRTVPIIYVWFVLIPTHRVFDQSTYLTLYFLERHRSASWSDAKASCFALFTFLPYDTILLLRGSSPLLSINGWLFRIDPVEGMQVFANNDTTAKSSSPIEWAVVSFWEFGVSYRCQKRAELSTILRAGFS